MKIEKLLKGDQLVIGLILILLLLITGMILKVEIHVNRLLQSNYDQKQLEKKIAMQDQLLNQLIHPITYPEAGLSSFKINKDIFWQKTNQKKFIEQLTKEVETLFPDCKISFELNSNLKRLTFNLKESEAQIEVVRQNREQLLEQFMLELTEFNPIAQFMLKETWVERELEEKLYVKNKKGEFIIEKVAEDNTNEKTIPQSEMKTK